MSNKYLFLNFENAGCFPKKVKGKKPIMKPDDIQPDGNTRIEMVFDDALINVDHISNVLHVLCGLHPVPSLYRTGLKRNEAIYGCASNSMIKFKRKIEPDKDGRYATEFMLGKKCKNNSNKEIKTQILINGKYETLGGIHNWKSWKRYLKNDKLYDRIVYFLSDVCQIDEIKSYSLFDIIEKYHSMVLTDAQKNVLSALLVDIENIKKRPICNILTGKSFDANSLNTYISNYPILNISSEKKVLRLDGHIMIPITDEILCNIKNNSGTATILDGGFIYIDEILDSIDTESLCDSGWNIVKKGWQTNNNDK